MHGSAFAARASVVFAKKFGDHGFKTSAFRQIMSVRPVISQSIVIGTKGGANPYRNGFLSDAKVNRATHLIGGMIFAQEGLFRVVRPES